MTDDELGTPRIANQIGTLEDGRIIISLHKQDFAAITQGVDMSDHVVHIPGAPLDIVYLVINSDTLSNARVISSAPDSIQ
jgi:hypothetical protein